PRVSSVHRRPPTFPLSPYTTLFRSLDADLAGAPGRRHRARGGGRGVLDGGHPHGAGGHRRRVQPGPGRVGLRPVAPGAAGHAPRRAAPPPVGRAAAGHRHRRGGRRGGAGPRLLMAGHGDAGARAAEPAGIRSALAGAGLGAAVPGFEGAVARPWAMLALAVGVSLPGLVAATWRTFDLRRSPVPAPPRTAAVGMLAGSVVLVDALVLAGLLL